MLYLIPICAVMAILFGVWLVAHTIIRAWNESIKTDPNHDYPWWDEQ